MSRFVYLSVGALLVTAASAQIPVLRKGVAVQMPVTTGAAMMPDADSADSLIVAVTIRGAVFLSAATVTPSQLSEEVKADLRGHPDKRVYLKADARASYGSVAEVLGGLRTAGIEAPILLTNQHDLVNASYVPPAGMEVLLAPPAPNAAQPLILRVGKGQPLDTELEQRVQRGRPVVLQADEEAAFGDVAHVVESCRKAGAKVYLVTAAR